MTNSLFRDAYPWAPCDCHEAYKQYPNRHRPEGCTATWTEDVIDLLKSQGYRIMKVSYLGMASEIEDEL